MGTPGKSAEIVNTYLEAVALATENNISKIVFVKEEKSIYFIVGVGELRKMISISDFSELFESKVDKEPGKGLSTNDYSNSEKEKLEGIEENAQRNIIEEIDLNGVKIDPVNKVVSINVDTEVTENSNNLVTSGAVHKKLDLKQDQLIPGDNITIQDNAAINPLICLFIITLLQNDIFLLIISFLPVIFYYAVFYPHEKEVPLKAPLY